MKAIVNYLAIVDTILLAHWLNLATLFEVVNLVGFVLDGTTAIFDMTQLVTIRCNALAEAAVIFVAI